MHSTVIGKELEEIIKRGYGEFIRFRLVAEELLKLGG